MRYSLIIRDIFEKTDEQRVVIDSLGITHGLLNYPFRGGGIPKMELFFESPKDFGLLKVSPFVSKTHIGKEYVEKIWQLGKFDNLYIDPNGQFPEKLPVEELFIGSFVEKNVDIKIGIIASHYYWLGHYDKLFSLAPNIIVTPIIDDEKMDLGDIFNILFNEFDNISPVIISLSTKGKIDLPYLLEKYKKKIDDVIFWSHLSLHSLDINHLKELTQKEIEKDKNTYIALYSMGIHKGPTIGSEIVDTMAIGSQCELKELLPEVDGIVWAKVNNGYVNFRQNGKEQFKLKGD
jgi:hypothetical protein